MTSDKELKSVLQKAGKDWNYDSFKVEEMTDKHALSRLAMYICKDILQTKEAIGLSDEVLSNYFELIESQYKDNPYHNATHGGEVAHSTLYFISNSFMKDFLDDHENFAALIACLGHDVGHSGFNNRYLVNN